MELPSFERYQRLFWGNKSRSVLRSLQYEKLQAMPTMGRVLDLGGGDQADYRSLVPCTAYDSINIDPVMQPTWVVEVGQPLPCPTGTYDTVLSMNTFEHIFDVRGVVSQLHRALKTQGSFVTMVPFLFPVHGHPDDFCRPTPSWWRTTLREVGFRDIQVRPLFWGRRATAVTCGGLSGPLKLWRTHWALLGDILECKLKRYSEELALTRAVGYWISAGKGQGSPLAGTQAFKT